MAQQLSTNTFGCAKWIVSPTASDGTHTTIATALTAASSGDTIVIRPGTYTENLTLKAGVNLTAFGSDSSNVGTGSGGNGTGVVIIKGKATFTGVGTVNIYGIQLQTNSDFFLAITGTSASIVNLNNCYLNCINNTGISLTTNSANAGLNVYDCTGDLGTTGIALFAVSGVCPYRFVNTNISNSGSSSTANTASGGNITYQRCSFTNATTTSGTAGLLSFFTQIDSTIGNIISLTIGGSGAATVNFNYLNSGSASAFSTSVTSNFIFNSIIVSSNTNAITGAGAITYSNLSFTSSSTINVTTQTGGVSNGGKFQAPSTGFIGQQLTANATAVATSSGTSKTITSVTLTAGVWDVSGSFRSTATGGAAVMQAALGGVSATDNTLSGNPGIDHIQINVTGAVLGSVVPLTRVVITANTTYYLVVQNFYTSTTCPTDAKITATRVG